MKWKAFLIGALLVGAAMWWRGPDRFRPGPPDGPAGNPIRVEVLNGSGVYRAGQGLAERLREYGFDVVDIRNADRRDYEETLVLDRVGMPQYADVVAGKLGLESAQEQRNGDLLLEVTVILGRDLAEEFRGGSLR
ncbi:MAG: LytR C-terminal domain-containing protein [Gemmatimonadetes bacterium]|nr:LytR C-terminal domain-containing protein [Gemmatimonadota bacterium]